MSHSPQSSKLFGPFSGIRNEFAPFKPNVYSKRSLALLLWLPQVKTKSNNFYLFIVFLSTKKLF